MRSASVEQPTRARQVENGISRGFKIAVFIAVAFLVFNAGVDQYEESKTAQAMLRVEPLTIITSKGENTIDVEMADAGRTMRRGLAGRGTLGDREGMLLHWAKRHRFRDAPAPARVTMQNTSLALDIIFVDSSGLVQSLARGMPQSLETIRSVGPTAAFLEIPAGVAAQFDIQPGDRLVHQMFDMAAIP